MLVIGLSASLPSFTAPAPEWIGRLRAELERVDADNHADIGVYVRDLDTGASASYRADESWYLASTVKLPIAIAVLRGVERGEYTLDTMLRLRASDYVDGSGDTNSHPAGSSLSIRYLIDQMMVYSDNTASDMLINLVGLAEVNTLVRSLVPHGFQPITTLADVRRFVYGQLDPSATRLAGKDFLLLKQQRSDSGRRQLLSRLLRTPVAEFRLPSVAHAYEAYYASGLNSARLDAYGELLALLSNGQALNPRSTDYLLSVMDRAKTGEHRIKAGLPQPVRFAHKTGTQSARTCDSGVISVPRLWRDQRIVVAACTRGEHSIAGSDRALRQVGLAICRSGLLAGALPHELHCQSEGPHARATANPPPSLVQQTWESPAAPAVPHLLSELDTADR